MTRKKPNREWKREESARLWAAATLGTAQLPDERLAARAVAMLTQKAVRPGDSIPQGARTPADAKGFYRFLENDRVVPAMIWNPIHEHTAKGLCGLTWVLAIQDTVTFMFPNLQATTGLGTIDKAREEGLLMHSTMALLPNGHVLGVLHNHVWARPLPEFGKSEQAKSRPFEDKESFEWVRGMQETRRFRDGSSPKTRLVHVFDTGGDVHEVLADILDHGDGAIIRCTRDRRVEGEEGYLRAKLAAQPRLDRYRIEIPRQKGQPARMATVELRSARVTLTPPMDLRTRTPLEINVVWVHEPRPPKGTEAVDWILYTTRPIRTAKDCRKVVAFYKLRWRIEEFHLILKSGCRIEQTQLKTAERIEVLLAFLSAAAVRIEQLTYWARTDPKAPCTLALAEDEWKVLWVYTHQAPLPPGLPVPTMEEAVRMIGRLGGHLGRKGDGMPGVRSLWRGVRDLQLLVEGYHVHP